MNQTTRWQQIKQRTLIHANLVLTRDMTIRQIESLGLTQVGRNTIHRDLTKNLAKISPQDVSRVKAILKSHKTNPSKYVIKNRGN